MSLPVLLMGSEKVDRVDKVDKVYKVYKVYRVDKVDIAACYDFMQVSLSISSDMPAFYFSRYAMNTPR